MALVEDHLHRGGRPTVGRASITARTIPERVIKSGLVETPKVQEFLLGRDPFRRTLQRGEGRRLGCAYPLVVDFGYVQMQLQMATLPFMAGYPTCWSARMLARLSAWNGSHESKTRHWPDEV